MLDNAITIKPRRQMSVQFSGGEPTLSPVLPGRGPLRAQGRLQQRAGGDQRHRIRQDAGVLPSRPPKPACATPTCSSTASATRPTRTAQVGNLFDVKLRAIENLHDAGVDIVPVTTIINGINNEQVGRIIQFALDNPKKISFLSLPAGFVYWPRRRHHRRAPRRRSATRCRTWRTT